MAAKLRGVALEVGEATIERQCDNVFLEQAADTIKNHDAVLSLGCGAGVQALAERYSGKPVYAGLDTAFIGILKERGIWEEKCSARWMPAGPAPGSLSTSDLRKSVNWTGSRSPNPRRTGDRAAPGAAAPSYAKTTGCDV